MAKHNVSLYRAMNHLRRGGLHRALHVPEGETIPKERIEAATKSKNGHVQKMAQMALNMSKFKH
jgi:hypothetical protein